MSGVQFGDKVRYELGGNSEEGFCIGFPHYSPGGEVIMFANKPGGGMPINKCWVTVLDSDHAFQANDLRDRFDAIYPGFLSQKE